MGVTVSANITVAHAAIMAAWLNGYNRVMRLGSLLLLGASLCACTPDSSTKNTMYVDENLTTPDVNVAGTDSNEIASPVKAHNYDDKDGSIYEYISAVSEEDAKKGRAVGDVVLLAFRGVKNGMYRLSAVADDGRTKWYYECSSPCIVIKRYARGILVDRLPFSPASVIGSAFEDALNRRLEESKEPAADQPVSHEGATPSYAPYSPASTAPGPVQEPQPSEGSDTENNGL